MANLRARYQRVLINQLRKAEKDSTVFPLPPLNEESSELFQSDSNEELDGAQDQDKRLACECIVFFVERCLHCLPGFCCLALGA